MKRIFRWTFLMTLCTTMVSCQTNLDVESVIDHDEPLILTRTITDAQPGLKNYRTDTIEVNSNKWEQLIKFAEQNQKNWKSTPASYNPDFSIRQNNFNLIGWIGGSSVVLSVTDKQGKTHQLTKKINKGELDFLIN